jgi:hypothetical protein
MNIEKLQKRYSNGFNPNESVARNTSIEREIFEKK